MNVKLNAESCFMPLRGDYNPYMRNNVATGSIYEQVQQMRRADADLRTQAQQLQARAEADGQSVATQLSYIKGPDGRNYVSAITVTRSEKVTIETASSYADKRQLNQPSLPQTFEDISPARFPLSPDELVEGFAQLNAKIGQEIAEASALAELQRVDSGVRVHEGLHFRAAGGIAESITDLDYIEGPDGQYYAVAGSVDVRTSATNDPQKAVREATAFAAAATAPGDASPQDMLAARGAFSHAADTYGRALAARSGIAPQYNMVA
jgi:hypothetical protein